MEKPKYFRRWRYGMIEFYSWQSFQTALWAGRFELQFNRWPPEKEDESA